jgi:hypothetical protein
MRFFLAARYPRPPSAPWPMLHTGRGVLGVRRVRMHTPRCGAHERVVPAQSGAGRGTGGRVGRVARGGRNSRPRPGPLAPCARAQGPRPAPSVGLTRPGPCPRPAGPPARLRPQARDCGRTFPCPPRCARGRRLGRRPAPPAHRARAGSPRRPSGSRPAASRLSDCGAGSSAAGWAGPSGPGRCRATPDPDKNSDGPGIATVSGARPSGSRPPPGRRPASVGPPGQRVGFDRDP